MNDLIINIDNNLLDNEGINIFFLMKEALYAYESSYGVGKIRSISDEVINALTAFVNYAFKEVDIEYINSLKIKYKSTKSNKETAVFQQLSELSQRGVVLLKIENNTEIDVSILKKLYRNAVLKHHPDHGGNIEDMQILNNAFEIFHNYLLAKSYNYNEKYSDLSLYSEYVFKCKLILSYLYGDFCAADKSYMYLLEADEIGKTLDKIWIGEIFSNFIAKGNWIDRPSYALSCCGMEKEAKFIEKILYKYWEYYCEHEYNVWLKTEDESPKVLKEWYKENLDVGKYYFTFNQKRIIIKIKEQADNLLRLKIINEQRYKESIKRIEKNKEKKLENIEKINNFIATVGFFPLVCQDIKIKNNKNIIHSPSCLYDRFALLDKRQKKEYLELLDPQNNKGDLFDKYYKVRINEILLYILNNFYNINQIKLLNEIKFFTDNLDGKYDYYSIINSMYNYLLSLDNGIRNNKISLLLSIDDPCRDYNHYIAQITKTGEHKKRIEVTNNYFEFIKLNNNDIENFKNTGKMPYVELNYDNWLKEKEKFDKIIEDNPLAKQYEKVIFSNNPPPDIVINSVEPYLNYLLSCSNGYLEKKVYYPNVSDFQIGYGLNKLTAAYVKIKRWDKVIYWIELFFLLDEIYRERSSKSEQETLKKRLERAKTMV
jgi:hypothetical protein